MATTSDDDRPWQSYHTAYTNAKAGMEGVDKEKVQKVIYEMSKGSKYFENEKRKEATTKMKIDNMHSQRAKLTDKDLSHFQKIAEKRILELESSRDLSKIWLHTDMDAFYAAVEMLEDPSLNGKPLAVGSMSMICTANYEARKFGVRAAMPGFIACKLCPDLIFVPTNFKKYTFYSDLTRKVFEKYDPDFLATSLDEAYINITEVCKERGVTSEEVAAELRNTIYSETGLTCSVGVAPNRMLAKVCSDINKPNGQFILPNDRKAIITFISSLPIRKIGGIGKVTEQILRDVLGIVTCEEMLQKSALLFALFSQGSSDFFLSIGLGLGGTETPQQRLRKSISSERTFHATEDQSLLLQKLADIAETLSNDMQKEHLCGRNLTLKIKTASFEVRTRAITLPKYIHKKEDILTHASRLLKAEFPLSIRLMGLRMSHFLDDKHCAADNMQKTLKSFLIKGDVLPADGLIDTGTKDGQVIQRQENDFSSHEQNNLASNDDFPDAFDSSELLESKQLFMLDNPTITNNVENSGSFLIKGDASPADVHMCAETNDGQVIQKRENDFSFHEQNSVTNNDDLSVAFDSSELLKSKQLSIFDNPIITINAESSGSSINEYSNKSTVHRLAETSKTVPISEQSREHCWIDGYICSICGVELPPSFVEERQEHLDYHLAEMLQKEESRLLTRERSVQQLSNKLHVQKKQKLSPKPGKYIPIDAFFCKGEKKL